MQALRALPSELTIYTIGEVYPLCKAWVDEPPPAPEAPDAEPCMRVGAAAVSEVDAAGVQLLLSLANTLHAQQRRLQLVDPSEALSAACAALGAACLTSSYNSEGQAQ